MDAAEAVHRAGGRHRVQLERKRDLATELEDVAAEIEVLLERETVAGTAAQRAERRFRGLEDEARSLSDQETLTPEGALAVVRGDVRSLEAAQQRDVRELETVDRRLEILKGQIAADSGERSRLNDEIRTLDDETAGLQKAYDEATKQRLADQASWETAEGERSAALLAHAAAEARLEAVAAAAEGRADPAARTLVEGATGHRGSLTSLLDIPADLAAAADAALGPWTDSAAFDTAERLEEAVKALKASGHGGMGVVVVQGSGGCPARSVAHSMGLEALVDRLGPSHDQEVAERLLGDVILVEGWSSAWTVVAKHPSLRAVTPEGDLVSLVGIRVAHPDGATPAMVESAAVALEQAETTLARAASRLATSQRDFERSRDSERRALEALERIEAQLAGATEALTRLRRSGEEFAAERERLDERKTALGEADVDRAEALDRLSLRLAALEGEEAERQAAWAEMESRRIAAEAERERARAEWQEQSSEHRGVVETLALVRKRRDEVDAALALDEASPVTDGELERLRTIEDAARRAIATIDEQLANLRVRQAELRSRAGETGIQRDAVRTRHETMRANVEAGRRRLGEIDVEATEVRVRRENASEALRRDVDASEAEALASPRPDVKTMEVSADDDLAPVLDDLEARLRRMGPINPLAAAEFAELEERHTFLTDQLSDLEASRDEVRRVITALDEEIQDQFTAAYEEIRTAYEENFSILFPGGSGRLDLTEPDQPLTSGVDIKAQPLGKRVSRMTLLSGGERSLAALAFLFAIFKARPSPFYVLDEVEAALDDANLRRFLRLVDTFRTSAQLVIITHQQQTMESANVLYGVTMEPGGSSTVVRKEIVPAMEMSGSSAEV